MQNSLKIRKKQTEVAIGITDNTMSKRKKKTNNGGHNTTQKTKDRAT